MNITDTQKHAISEKLNRAIEAEHIMLTEAARNLGTSANYLSMIRYPKQWPRCAKSGWEAVHQWANSGQKIKEYSTAHGRTMMTPEVKKVLVEEVKSELQKVKDEANKQKYEEAVSILAAEKPASNVSLTAPLQEEPITPEPGQQFTDTARLKVCLDVEINLVINGQKIRIN